MPTPPFEQLLRRLQAGVATLEGPQLRYGFVNEQMRVLVGANAEGQTLAEHIGQLPTDLRQILPQVYASGTAYVGKACACLPTASGNTPQYYDLLVDPYHDEHDKIAGLLLLAVEVSEQELARQQAHELTLTTRHLDARLRVMTETAPLFSYSVAPDGKVTYVSPQWHRFTGQPPAADISSVWPLLIHPDDRLRVLYEEDIARRTSTGWSHEYRLRRYDGQYRWVLSRAQPEVHPPDAPVFWHGALTEIHLQRELSEARRRGEAEVRFLADSIPELVWTASAEGLVDYYNQYTLDYSGLNKEELGPTGWVGLLYSEEQPAAARRWVQSVASGEDFTGEYRLRRADGTYRWHTIRIRQLNDGSGPRWFGAGADIEEQYRLREVLQTQYNELERAHHNLDTFVYAASHDLRQPTTNLRGLFDELRRSINFTDPQQNSMLRMVDTALTHLDSTLSDLMESVSTKQDGLELLSLDSVLDEFLMGLNPQIIRQGARVEVNVRQAPTLLYSRSSLRSVVHNLVSNALKFVHPDRTPHVVLRSYQHAAGQPVLEVKDNGLGMRIDKASRQIFPLFSRQHTHVEGTGVGLYLVQRIVTSQGGHIQVESTVNEGTTFRVFWATPAQVV